MTAEVFQARHVLVDIPNPGMITTEEEQLYYHLAQTFWHPDRFFFEFGTWLGRSTTRICQGLESAAPKRWRLNCFDLFRWHDDHIPKAAKAGMPAVVAGLKAGDSFREAFLSLMGEFAPRITTFQGAIQDAPDLLAGAFPPSAKLGVLFVDASKGWENSQLLKAVAPHLTVGTRIVFQDFFINSAVSLQLLLMLLPQLEPELVVTHGGSLVFKVVGTVRADDPLFEANGFKAIRSEMIYSACERLRTVIPQQKYDDASLAVTLPALLWRRGYQDEAYRAAEGLELSESQCRSINNRIARHPVINVPPILARVARAPS